ncbi:hypothetical protein [Rhodanobacter sp. A1T4]|uniref:hypothetical protein n=1 Tax=Rhodanobacter sp. A1T4 TaxID=2723087 RepID=UPI001621AC9A|nr:hypothetical protein [Rhodanobacter sp. A1T4]MBB6248159.1 hypothetical protein [Rhodanobacter sp. A1T4]
MIRHNVLRAPLLAGLIAGIVALPAMAQQTGTSQQQSGLGQSWPQAKNVSAAPGWRVYVFVQDEVKYIQVNDLVGTVRATVATANGYFLVLPLGADAQRVSTPARPLAAALNSTAPAIMVYQDNAVQLTARYQSDGSTVWTATAKTSPKTTTTPALAPADAACPPCAGVTPL